MHFFYLFLLTLINSLWQSAVLLLLYYTISSSIKNIHPLQKRNLLYGFLFLQIGLSILSFYCLKYKPSLSYTFTLENNWLNDFLLNNEVLLFCIYAVLVILKMSLVGYQWSKFYFNYKKYIQKPALELRLYASSHAMQLGITREITLWYSTAVSTPITFGFLKPVILLPITICTQLQQKEIETIILHELTHIKHKDYLLNWLLVIVEIIFVLNPFILIIIRNIKLEREKNCDTTVINFKYDNISYAESLLMIAKNASNIKGFQIAAVKNISQLYKRIEFFCSPNNFQFKTFNTSFYAILLLPFFLILLLPTIKQKQPVLNYSKPIYAAYNPINKNEMLYETLAPVTVYNMPLLEKELSTVTKPIEITTVDAALPYEIPTNNLYKFASIIDTLENTKEFIYNIESPSGKITKTFELKFTNGNWVLIPKLLILQKYNDSNALLRIDSTSNGLDSLVQ